MLTCITGSFSLAGRISSTSIVLTDLESMVNICDDSVETRDNVDLGLLGNDLTLDLVTHGSHGFLRGSDEGHTDFIQSLDKGSVLGQEAVTYLKADRVRL